MLEALKAKEPVRAKLKPLFDAGWTDLDTAAGLIIRERPQVFLHASIDEHDELVVTAAPGDTKCTLKSATEAIDFAAALKKAVEEQQGH